MKRYSIRQTLTFIGALVTLIALIGCDGNSDPPVKLPSPELPSPSPSPPPLPPDVKARTIPKVEESDRYCLVRKVPESPGSSGQVEVKVPVAAIRLDDWPTINDVKITFRKHATNCPDEGLDAIEGILSIAAAGSPAPAGAVDVTVKVGSAAILSQRFKRVGSGAYLYAAADTCMGGCDTYDGYHAFLYIVEVPNRDGALSKLVMLDLFSARAGLPQACLDEKPSAPGTLQQPPLACPTPRWIFNAFGLPENTELPVASQGEVGIKQTGSGGGYEPPP